MKELVYSVKMVTRDALLGRIVYAADSFTMPAEVCNERSSQPSGSGGGGCIFENGLLSTDKFKLNVISRR
jgi:hypothetical protein